MAEVATVESGGNLKRQVSVPMTAGVDDTAALNRRGLLIETVTASVADILAAPVVQQALPPILAAVAMVVRIDRMVIVNNEPLADGTPNRDVFFRWEGFNAPPVPEFNSLVGLTAGTAMAEFVRPLSEGRAVVATLHAMPSQVRAFFESIGVVSTLLVPIMVDGKHWGQACFDDCGSEHDWAPDDIKILQLLAGVIGAAITRERFLRESQQREQLLNAVSLSAAAIMTAPDLQEAIARALEAIARAVGVDRVLLFEKTAMMAGAPLLLLRNAWQSENAPVKHSVLTDLITNVPPPDVQAWLAPLLRGVTMEDNLSKVKGDVHAFFERFQIKSTLLVPIMVDGAYWGHIAIDDCRHGERLWTRNENDILRTLAELIGTAMKRERYVEELAKANTIIQNSPTVLYRLRGEPAFPMIYISQNVSLLGYDPATLVGSPTLYFSHIHSDDRARVQTALAELLKSDAPPITVAFRMHNKAGEARWIENRFTPVRSPDGRLIEIEGMFTDITERRIAEEQIALLARSDPLTSLANRSTFADRLRQAFAAARRGSHSFAVMYLDLDHFKEINDTLGHMAGDQLLRQVADRLRHATREVDVVSRLGGDEFAILQTDVADSTEAGRLAEKLVELLSEPYSIDGHAARIGASVGISMYSADTDSPDELLAEADQALYRAKDSGRGRYRFHSDQIDHEAREHLALAEDLRNALGRGELEIRYQPQVELATRKIVGMEALLRWHHPVRGTLLPEDFLPIAEKFGIMQQLGRWVLDGACQQMSKWRAEKMHVPVMAINVALAQIKMGHEFVRDVTETIARWGLVPSDIELDVTELVLARTTLSQSHVLDDLRRMGIAIAIDDFGAQYSSLDYLRTYHVNRLKIARGMTAAAAAEPGGLAMVRAILSLAGELGVQVVAEGVETEQQRSLLVQANATAQGQGFYFGKVLGAEETSRILREGLILPDELPPDDP